jgi:hypothetical protein
MNIYRPPSLSAIGMTATQRLQGGTIKLQKEKTRKKKTRGPQFSGQLSSASPFAQHITHRLLIIPLFSHRCSVAPPSHSLSAIGMTATERLQSRTIKPQKEKTTKKNKGVAQHPQSPVAQHPQ